MIYVLHGPDEYSVREQLRKLLRAALPEETADLNTTRLAASEVSVEALRFACEAVPFLADRRVAIVQGLLARLSRRRTRAAAGAAAEETADAPPPEEGASGLAREIAEYLPQVPENALLILVESEAPPKSGPLGKALSGPNVRQQFFTTLAGPPLVRWIKQRARESGVTVEDGAAVALAAFVGGDLHALSNELAKLAAYAGPARTVAAADVRLLVNQAGEATVFDLVDAIGQGNRTVALTALHRLMSDGERPERILGMVARQVRLLLQARDAQDRGRSAEEVARLLGLHPFPLRKLLDQVRLFRLPQLAHMHRQVLETDLALKTGQLDPPVALDLLVAALTAERAPLRAQRRA